MDTIYTSTQPGGLRIRLKVSAILPNRYYERKNVGSACVVVVASYCHLAQSFIYTKMKSRRGAGRFAGRVKYSRVLV